MKKRKQKTKPGLWTKTMLDSQCCDHCCDCGRAGRLFLLPICHEAPAQVSYEKGSGELIISCLECEKEIARIMVADPIARN